MEPFLLILVPGLLGGIVVALASRWLLRSPDDGPAHTSRLQPVSTDTINMARINVSGVGGLGMVAMAVTVALFVPRIRLTMALALALGVVFAIALIAHRRKLGPLPSAGARPGGHSELSVYAPDVPPERDRGNRSTTQAFAPALGKL